MGGTESAYPKWGVAERQRNQEMRDHAFRLWEGAPSVGMDNPDGERFYGWSVLSLAARFDYPFRLESRIVYAHLFDEEQKVAILRAVSWDSSVAHRAISELRQNARLVIPVRFVRLPEDQLREWLAVFKDMMVTAEQTEVQDRTLPIRRVRIEWEYTSCVLEKIWQEQGPQHAALVAAWTSVWQRMGEALGTHPPLEPTAIEEHFDVTAPDRSAYDASGYDPGWLGLA